MPKPTVPEKTLEERDHDKFLSLALLADSDGGKIVISNLLLDITNTIERLSTEYKAGSHFDLVRLCADLNSRLSLYRALTRAKKNLRNVDAIIAEALTDTSD